MAVETLEVGGEPVDLVMFSFKEDLVDPSLAKHFNTKELDQTINSSAHRALQVCNATAQLMLAKYITDKVDDVNAAKLRAEHIAYDLGDEEYDPDQPRNNPFEEPILAAAWQAGYDSAKHSKRLKPLAELESKYWNEGVNTEDSRSQYELCALQLYKIAAQLERGKNAERAKHLAMEMCRYHEGETPSIKRQIEIDRFMARQAERIAEEIDF